MQFRYTTEEGFIDRASVDRRAGGDRRQTVAQSPGPVQRRPHPRRKVCTPENAEIFKFRALSSITELFWAFRTRYKVYRDVGFIAENDDALDIDGWDPRSVHLGAFRLDSRGDEQLIGTLRHVTWEASPMADEVYELAKRCREPRIRHLEAPGRPLPMFESFPMRAYERAIVAVAGGDHAHDIRPFEVSRLTVLPSHWHKGITRGLHELVTLWSRNTGYLHKDAVIATHPHNVRKYRSMGFTRIDGTEEILYKGLKQPAIAMQFDLHDAYQSHPYYRPCATIDSFFAAQEFFYARY